MYKIRNFVKSLQGFFSSFTLSMTVCLLTFMFVGGGSHAQSYLQQYAQQGEEIPQNDNPPPPDQADLEEGYLINFPNVSIIEYIRFISQITKKNFIYKEEELQFSVTILSEEPTSIENIIAALVQILRIHDLQLLEQGNNLIIHRNPDIRQVPRVVADPAGETGIVTRVFQFKNVDPESILKIVRPLISASSLIEVSEATRHLIVTDIGSNVAQVGKLLRDLDAPNVTLDIGSYSSRYTHIDSLVELSEKILEPLSESNPLVLVPQHRSKTIFIVSTPYMIKKTISVLKALDIPSEEEEVLPTGHIDATHFYVHKLQYHRGSNIIGPLQNVATSLTSSGDLTNAGLVNAISTSQWIESTNSLLFTGDSNSLRKVRELVDSLDTPLRQVYIEMLIIETNITKSLEFGVDWALTGSTSDASFGINSFNYSDPSGYSLPTATSMATNGNTPLSTGLNIGVIGRAIRRNGADFTSLGALVKALQTDNDTEILLNPRIITQDTSPANVFVGGTSAFQAQQTSQEGNTVAVTVEHRDVGTNLTVTPILGPSDIITLEIDQVSTVDLAEEATDIGANQVRLGPITTKNSTKTKVHLPDGHFLILSGMINETKRKDEKSIPCLGSIPYIGKKLFGSTNNATVKKNVMIFLRAVIVDTFDKGQNLTNKHKKVFDSKSGARTSFDLDTLLEPMKLGE